MTLAWGSDARESVLQTGPLRPGAGAWAWSPQAGGLHVEQTSGSAPWKLASSTKHAGEAPGEPGRPSAHGGGHGRLGSRGHWEREAWMRAQGFNQSYPRQVLSLVIYWDMGHCQPSDSFTPLPPHPPTIMHFNWCHF